MCENSSPLLNKNILFFSQFFFGYENKICEKFIEMGASVDMFDEMSIKKPFERALLKVSSNIFSHKTNSYYHDILSKLKGKKYDYILFIDCEMSTLQVLDACKRLFPEAKMCLHLWDSVENLKGVPEKFHYFDIVTSFDPDDCKKYKLVLRPLFFCDEYRAQDTTKDYEYDMSFIGTIHSDRFKILKKIKSNLPNQKMFVYPYLQSRFIYYYYLATKKEFWSTKINNFKFKKLSANTIADVVDKSKTIIDIQHPKQTGLTMRTLEMVGMNKKLITTNKSISQYDFYNPNNICIIDRENPTIDLEFFNRPYEKLPESTYEKYSINSWVNDVLGMSKV